MKKAVLLILIVLYAEKIFSYECRASKDANLYGNAYPFKVSDRIGTIKENSAVYFDSIQLTTYTIDGEASYLNASYSYYLRITTESGNQGYISLLDISSMKNVSAIHDKIMEAQRSQGFFRDWQQSRHNSGSFPKTWAHT